MAKPIGLLLITLAASAVLALHAPPAFDQAGGAAQCLNVGEWARPGHGGVRRLTAPALYDEAARQRVVLLGEQHDDAEHHRWQLQVLGALHARRPDMALGFEMFPRRVQPVLDRWVAGELSEADFLREADWDEVWGFDARLYLPLFHFARMNRIPMLALNVDNALVREVGRAGLDAVPPERREGVGRPAPLHPDYRAALLEAFRMHMRAGPHGGEDAGDSPAFRHFTDAQLLRDRAFAEGIAAVAARSDAPLVVGIIGAGHMRHGHGVPQQLAALGIDRVAVYLPHEAGGDCRTLAKGYADAVFGVRAPPADASWRPLLGVRLSDAGDGVRVDSVVKDSPAEAAGLRAGDVIAQIAGEPVNASRDVVAAVQRQAPGTWLPLLARRDGTEIEIVAKFPSRARPTP